MKRSQRFSDKAAMGLSLLCTLHCWTLPFLLTVFPSVASLPLGNEAFHFGMIIAVIPISIYALTLGCKQHQQKRLLAIGLIGLTFLMLALFLPKVLFGELGEKLFTMIGSGLIALSHYKNYRLCKSDDSCLCPKHQKSEYGRSAST